MQEEALKQAPDAQPVGGLYQALADEDNRKSEWSFELQIGNCYWFSAAGDQGVEEISLYLRNPKDHKVAKLGDKGPRVVLNYCPDMSGMFKLEAKVHHGEGHYAVGLYSRSAQGGAPPVAAQPGPAPTGAKPAPTTAPSGPAGDLATECDNEARAKAQGATRVGNHFSGNADETDWYTQLDVGKCYWLVGVGSPEIKALWVQLWDTEDRPIRQAKSNTNRVVVDYCPTKTGMHHFQAKIGAGSGDYKVGVYAKDAAKK